MTADGHGVTLSLEQLEQLFDVMDTVHYKKLGRRSGLSSEENYGNLTYMTEDTAINIMFSSQQGGSLLIGHIGQNPVETFIRFSRPVTRSKPC